MIKSEQDPSYDTDENVLRLITQGEKSALILLFDRYAADLYRYILSLVRINKSESLPPEDVTKYILADVFKHLWDARNTLQVPTTLRAYLFSAAFNIALGYTRYRKDHSIRKAS